MHWLVGDPLQREEVPGHLAEVLLAAGAGVGIGLEVDDGPATAIEEEEIDRSVEQRSIFGLEEDRMLAEDAFGRSGAGDEIVRQESDDRLYRSGDLAGGGTENA